MGVGHYHVYARRKTVLSDLKLKVILRHNVKQKQVSLFITLWAILSFLQKIGFSQGAKNKQKHERKKECSDITIFKIYLAHLTIKYNDNTV